MLNKNLCAIWELTETVTPLMGSSQAGSQSWKGQVDLDTQPFQEAACNWQSLEKTKFSFANLILLLYKPPLRASPIPISIWPTQNEGHFLRLFISYCFFRHSLSYWSFVSILWFLSLLGEHVFLFFKKNIVSFSPFLFYFSCLFSIKGEIKGIVGLGGWDDLGSFEKGETMIIIYCINFLKKGWKEERKQKICLSPWES